MTRKNFLKQIVGVLLAPVAAARCAPDYEDPVAPLRDSAATTPAAGRASWRAKLSDAEYEVLFEADTEPPWSSPLNDEHRAGTYICAACYLPLFSSDTKFDSGTGWPSFWAPLPGQVATKPDYWLIVPRTEYHCTRCGGHQGHVFDDGPPPTGKRWCNNGLALNFVPEGDPLPDLRG